MEQLLNSGTVCLAREPELKPREGQIHECCDHPFSRPSQNVLKILLEYYKGHSKLVFNFTKRIVSPKSNYCNIASAIYMGNLEGVKIILDSRKFRLKF